MKKHHTDEKSPTDQPDLQRRHMNRLIAAVTVLGTGLGVNMREVFAAGPKPAADNIKWEKGTVQQPGVNQIKGEYVTPARPDASYLKNQPAANQYKIQNRPGAKFLKNQPSADYGKIENRPDAKFLKMQDPAR